MSVHVDEIHSEVVASGDAAGPGPEPAPPAPVAEIEERVREAFREAGTRAARLAAEGFDD